MPVLGNEGDFDPRNHKSFLIPGYELESLADVPEEKAVNLNSLLLEADELELDEMRDYCHRWIALHTGVDGKRARLAAEVAKRDEALRMVEAENRRNNETAAQDDGPVAP